MYLLNKYYGMANIKDYPLRKIADFLQFAYEKETYERWLTIYPLMEAGITKFISFKEYKDKIKKQAIAKRKNANLTDEKIIDDSMKIVQIYEKHQQKAGDEDGNI